MADLILQTGIDNSKVPQGLAAFDALISRKVAELQTKLKVGQNIVSGINLQQFSNLTSRFGSATTAANRFQNSLDRMAGTLSGGLGIGLAVGGLAILERSFSRAIEKARQFQTAQLAIAATIQSSYKVVTPQGKELQGYPAFQQTQMLGQKLNLEIIKRQAKNILTYEEELGAFQSALASGSRKGLNPDQILKVSENIAIVAKTLGLHGEQIANAARLMLGGGVNVMRSTVGRALGVTNADIAGRSGQDLIDFIMTKTRGFSAGQPAFAKSIEGIISTLEANLDIFFAKVGTKLFSKLTPAIEQLSKALEGAGPEKFANTLANLFNAAFKAIESIANSPAIPLITKFLEFLGNFGDKIILFGVLTKLTGLLGGAANFAQKFSRALLGIVPAATVAGGALSGVVGGAGNVVEEMSRGMPPITAASSLFLTTNRKPLTGRETNFPWYQRRYAQNLEAAAQEDIAATAAAQAAYNASPEGQAALRAAQRERYLGPLRRPLNALGRGLSRAALPAMVGYAIGEFASTPLQKSSSPTQQFLGGAIQTGLPVGLGMGAAGLLSGPIGWTALASTMVIGGLLTWAKGAEEKAQTAQAQAAQFASEHKAKIEIGGLEAKIRALGGTPLPPPIFPKTLEELQKEKEDTDKLKKAKIRERERILREKMGLPPDLKDILQSKIPSLLSTPISGPQTLLGGFKTYVSTHKDLLKENAQLANEYQDKINANYSTLENMGGISLAELESKRKRLEGTLESLRAGGRGAAKAAQKIQTQLSKLTIQKAFAESLELDTEGEGELGPIPITPQDQKLAKQRVEELRSRREKGLPVPKAPYIHFDVAEMAAYLASKRLEKGAEAEGARQNQIQALQQESLLALLSPGNRVESEFKAGRLSAKEAILSKRPTFDMSDAAFTSKILKPTLARFEHDFNLPLKKAQQEIEMLDLGDTSKKSVELLKAMINASNAKIREFGDNARKSEKEIEQLQIEAATKLTIENRIKRLQGGGRPLEFTENQLRRNTENDLRFSMLERNLNMRQRELEDTAFTRGGLQLQQQQLRMQQDYPLNFADARLQVQAANIASRRTQLAENMEVPPQFANAASAIRYKIESERGKDFNLDQYEKSLKESFELNDQERELAKQQASITQKRVGLNLGRVEEDYKTALEELTAQLAQRALALGQRGVGREKEDLSYAQAIEELRYRTGRSGEDIALPKFSNQTIPGVANPLEPLSISPALLDQLNKVLPQLNEKHATTISVPLDIKIMNPGVSPDELAEELKKRVPPLIEDFCKTKERTPR